MNKSELLSMPQITATRKMLRMAKDDKPKCEAQKFYGHTYEQRKYKNWLYVKSVVQGDILKLVCFLTEPLRERCHAPAFEIYLDRKNRDYLTYVPEDKKWLTACFNNLPMPSYCCYSKGIVVDRLTVKQINSFFGTSYDAEGIMWSVRKFQQGVMAERLKLRHKKITDPWDADLSQTRELPKDWARWVDKVGIPEQFIFYDYTRKKYKKGYCTYCGHEVMVQPRHNESGVCPHCHRKVTFKALGRFKRFSTADYVVYLPQKCRDGFMLREFVVHRYYTSKSYKSPEIKCSEVRRVIGYPNGSVMRAYYFGNYKNRELRWIKTATCSPHGCGYQVGRIYGKSLVCLDKTYFRRTGLVEYYRANNSCIDPEQYLAVYEVKPYIEKIVKAGLWELAKDVIKDFYHSRVIAPDVSQTSLTKILHISPSELKRLREFDGGMDMLRLMQYEKSSGVILPDDTLKWFMTHGLEPSDFSFITAHMTIPQIKHYLTRQMDEGNMRLREAITTWKDYLSMAGRLGYDVNDEIVYRVRRLKQRHGELVEILQNKDMAIRASEIAAEYSHAEANLRDAKPIYSYGDDDCTVIVPEKIEEILAEGRKLHHCVAEHERYWDRIERKESFIFFLRKTASVDTPYYTLEVEPGGTIRQKRTSYDKQNSDIEAASDFLRKWQSVVRTRLRDEDKRLAEQSEVLRRENFEQLRRDNVRINTGTLQGARLVDVLMADLMVAA